MSQIYIRLKTVLRTLLYLKRIQNTSMTPEQYEIFQLRKESAIDQTRNIMKCGTALQKEMARKYQNQLEELF